jgi:hypothetical protein
LVERGANTKPRPALSTAPARRVVARLRRLWLAHQPSTDRPVMAYGDLKPEHVLFADTAATDRPVLVDPALMRATATVDAAKFVSRTMLLLISCPPGSINAASLAGGLVDFVDKLAAASVRDEAGAAWWRKLVLLWLCDTVNIVTTYLSAPPKLPLPPHAVAVLAHARTLWTLVDRLSAELAAGTHPYAVWQLGVRCAARHELPT